MSLSPSPVVARLRAAGCVFAEDEARVLLGAASGGHLAELVERRVAGQPLEHVVGWAAFCGLRVAVDPGVFVPRRRTELLVRRAAAVAPPGGVVVDLCCGSGAVAVALHALLPAVELHAADISAVAVANARRNLPGAQVHLGDLFDALPLRLRGRIDVLTANAPYVPTSAIGLLPPEARLHEPLVALDGGADGLELHRRLADGAPSWLAPGGAVLVETGSAQALRTAELFALRGMAAEVTHCDAWEATVVVATRRR